MSSSNDPSTGFLTMLAAGVGLCCGLPLLLGTGLAIGATGFYVGSGVLITAGVAVGAWAWHRRRRATCDLDDEAADSAEQGRSEEDTDAGTRL